MENMNFLPHIAGRILNVPLMITPQGLDVILHAIGPRIGIAVNSGQILAEKQEDIIARKLLRQSMRNEQISSCMPGQNLIVDMSIPKRYRSERGEDGIALIPIYNTLVYRQFGDMQPISGHLTSYEEVWSWYDEANQDSSIHTIVFDVESNGGEVAGAFDTIDHITATKQKPVIAIVNESAYSAAYGLSSAADKIYLPRTGGAGSIGVISVHVNKALANEKEGLQYTPIFAGSHKNDFSPNQPLSEEAFRVAKEQIDEVYNLFVKTAATNRKTSQKAIRETEAGIFQGQKAVDIGLADGVKSFSEVIEMIQNNHNKGGKRMSAKVEAQPVEKEAAVINQPSQAELDKIKADVAETAKKEAREAETSRIHGIRQACFAVKHLIQPNLMDQFISEGVSLEEANKRIIASLAQKSEETQVNSNVSALSSGQKNSLVENAKKRAAMVTQKGPLI